MEESGLVVAASFLPPDAHRRYRAWRTSNASVLSTVAPEQIRVDIGRTEEGDFVRVWLPREAADRLVTSAEEHS